MAPRAKQKGPKEGQVLRQLVEGPVSPVYLLYGKERFFIRRAVGILKQKVLDSPDMNELLYHVLYASETNEEELLGLAGTMPFFDRTQLILVYEAEKIKDAFGKALLEYAEDPSPFTCMVLVAGEELPKREPFKTLQKNRSVACRGFPWLKASPRKAWLRDLAREKGFSPGDSASWMDGLLAGGDVSLEVLENQLDIMRLYLEGGESKGLDDPMPFLFADIPPEQGYLFTDALIEGKGQEAMELLGRFLGQGTYPPLLLSRMAWEARKLWGLQAALAAGQTVKDACVSSKILPFKVDSYHAAARRMVRASLAQMFLCLHETEIKLKMGSALDSRWHLEEACKAFIRVAKGGEFRKAG